MARGLVITAAAQAVHFGAHVRVELFLGRELLLEAFQPLVLVIRAYDHVILAECPRQRLAHEHNDLCVRGDHAGQMGDARGEHALYRGVVHDLPGFAWGRIDERDVGV